MRATKAIQYIFFEIVPGFFLGLLVFIFIMLMFQALRLTEFALVHGVGLKVIGEIMGYLSISFLPALLPMALLFSVLLAYGRLSSDSEVIAMKACGLSQASLTIPAVIISVLVAIFSAQTSFNIGPWGNRQFEVLIDELGRTKAGATLREGSFSEGFFNLVVYANEVNSKTGALKKVFIYDENQDIPMAVIAKKGQLVQDPDRPGHNALLRLQDGNIHRKSDTHTKINFNSYDIHLEEPIRGGIADKSNQSFTLEEIKNKLNDANLKPDEKRTFETEYHKRWAISGVCIIFALLGVGLGTVTNKRSAKSSGLIVCLGLIIFYWILYVSCEGLARSGKLPPAIAIWIPNSLYLIFALKSLRSVWD